MIFKLSPSLSLGMSGSGHLGANCAIKQIKTHVNIGCDNLFYPANFDKFQLKIGFLIALVYRLIALITAAQHSPAMPVAGAETSPAFPGGATHKPDSLILNKNGSSLLKCR